MVHFHQTPSVCSIKRDVFCEYAEAIYSIISQTAFSAILPKLFNKAKELI